MKIDVFYTGGGITLAEATLDGGRYAVVSTDNLGCISIYNENEDSDPYMPEDMVGSFTAEEMDAETKVLYLDMLEALEILKNA